MVLAPLSSNTSNPTVWGYHGRLGDLLFRFSVSEREPFTITRSFSQHRSVDVSANPEDFTDDFGLNFSQVDFNGGEGRRFAHRPSTRGDASNQTSFYRSYGLRLNDDNDLEIVNTMEEIIAGGTPSPQARAAWDSVNEDLYITDGTADLVKVSNLNSDPPTTGTEVTGAVNDLTDVLFLGQTVYVADGVNVIRSNQGTGTWAGYASGVTFTRLWRAKNRIIASDGRRLYEDPAGSTVTGSAFIELPAGEEWVDLVDEGEYVVAVASDGEIYTFSFDGTNLSLAGETELHREKVTAVGALYGAVLLMSYQLEDGGTEYRYRLWRGDINDAGTFSDLRVLREWTTSTEDSIPTHFEEAERDNIYWAIDDGTDTSLWRYNLEDAYVMSDKIMDGLTGTNSSVIGKLLGRLWVVSANGDVWREDPDVQRSSGTFIGPAVDFFNADRKMWEQVKVVGEFPTNAQIKVYTANNTDAQDAPNDNTEWTLAKTYRQNTDQNVSLTVPEARYLTTRIVLTNGAKLRAYTLRALPPLSDEEIVLRINASDDVFRPGKKRQRVRGLGEAVWQKVRNIQGTSVDLELYDLDTIWRGSLVQVGTPVSTYRPDGSLTKTIEIVFRGEPITTTTIDTQTWGAAQWGVGLWGSDTVT